MLTFLFFPLHVVFYLVLICLFICKSPNILRHSWSCFLITLNLYVQIRELGTRRLSRQRKTWSISKSSRSSCSEARSSSRNTPSCPGASSFAPGVPRLFSGAPSLVSRIFPGASHPRSRSSDHLQFGQQVFCSSAAHPGVSA